MKEIEKRLKKVPDGAYFTGTINGVFVGGRIRKENDTIYFCTNSSQANGDNCSNKYGYNYSLAIDHSVDDDIKIVKGKSDLPKEINIGGYTASVSSKQVIVGCQTVTFAQVKNLLDVLKAINKFPKVVVGNYSCDYEDAILKKGSVALNGEHVTIQEVEKVYKEMLRLQKK